MKPVAICNQARRLVLILFSLSICIIWHSTELFAQNVSTKLNESITAQEGDAYWVEFTKDGNYVVYMRQISIYSSKSNHLYVMPSSGGEPRLLSSALPSNNQAYFGRYKLSPDSKHVIFLDDREIPDQFALYSAELANGDTIKLPLPVSADGPSALYSLIFLPNRQQLFYEVFDRVTKKSTYYLVAVDGTNLLDIGFLFSPGDKLTGCTPSPNELYFLCHVVKANDAGTKQTALYRISADGKSITDLTPPGMIAEEIGCSATSDSSHVICSFIRRGENNLRFVTLYSIADDGLGYSQLTPDPINEEDFGSMHVSNDGKWVFYSIDKNIPVGTTDTSGCTLSKTIELYSVPVDGGTISKLSGPLSGCDSYSNFEIAPDSSHVVYRQSRFVSPNRFEGAAIFSVPIGGGTPIILTPSLQDNRAIGWQQIAADSQRVLFSVSGDKDPTTGSENFYSVYSVSLTGGLPVTLTSAIPEDRHLLDFALSPDGKQLVYLADQDTANKDELFSIPVTGGIAIKLNAPLPANGDVHLENSFWQPPPVFEIDAQSRYVVYAADQEEEGRTELFRVPITGGKPMRLHPAFASAEDGIIDFDLSPDGSYLQFWDFTSPSNFVSIEGGTPANASLPESLEGDVTNFVIGADGKTVFYWADQERDQYWAMYRATIEPHTTTQLMIPTFSFGDFQSMALTPNQDFMVFHQRTDSSWPDLWSLRTNGDAQQQPTRLGTVEYADTQQASLAYTADGEQIVFANYANRGVIFSNSHRLSSMRLDGSQSITLTILPDYFSGSIRDSSSLADTVTEKSAMGPMLQPFKSPNLWADDPNFPDDEIATDDHPSQSFFKSTDAAIKPVDDRVFKISKDGKTVVYKAHGLFKTPIDASAPVTLSSGLDSLNWFFAITQDSRYVVANDSNQLYRIDLAAALSETLTSGDKQIVDFRLSNDSQFVVFRAAISESAPIELYSVRLNDRTTTQLSQIQHPNGDVVEYSVTPDSHYVVYRADQDLNGVFELFSVPIGGGSLSRINGTLTDLGDVVEYEITPDSKRIVYIADQQNDGVYELFSTLIDGMGGIRLNTFLPYSGDVTAFQIDPMSNYVVYRADQLVADRMEIYQVSLSGGNIYQLNDPLVSGGDVAKFEILPNSNGVIYLADQEKAGLLELFASKPTTLLTIHDLYLPVIQR